SPRRGLNRDGPRRTRRAMSHGRWPADVRSAGDPPGASLRRRRGNGRGGLAGAPGSNGGRGKPPRASLPARTAASAFEEGPRRRSAEERLVEGLRNAGYREAIVPSADYLAPYAEHLGTKEERELYRFVDRHGDTIALRADFTIAIARHLAPRLSSGG